MKLINNKIIFIAFTLLSLIIISQSKLSLKSKSKSTSLFELNKNFLISQKSKLHDKFSANLSTKIKNSHYLKKNLNSNYNGPVFQGWLKYLEISDDSSAIPDCFVKNKMFYLQMSENPSINTISKDNMGYLNIPNEQYFWLELDNMKLNAYTSRNPRYRKKENCLNIIDLVPEITTNPCRGGVEDVGNFTEGYCFMLKFLKYNRHYIWELCAETQVEKEQWMNRITRIQKNSLNFPLGQSSLPLQHSIIPSSQLNTNSLFTSKNHVVHSVTHITHRSNLMNSGSMLLGNGWIPNGDWSPCSQSCGSGYQRRPLRCQNPPHCLGPDFEERICQIKACKIDLDSKMGDLQKIADGNWELLGTWSSCSKPCGGGIQTIERRCLNQNCQGDSLLSQPCNLNPCGDKNTNTFLSNNLNIIDPLNKNSVEECRIIEGNLSVYNPNGGYNTNGLSNIHVILTSNHLDVYPLSVGGYGNYNSVVPQQSFVLSHITNLHYLPNNRNCFMIKDDTNNNLNLCSNENSNSFDWLKKIEDYRSKCNNKILDNITRDMENCVTPVNAEQKLNNISKQVIDEQINLNKNKGFLLDKQFQEFQNQVRDLLNKEDSYEANLENQEKERIIKEKMQMQDIISREEIRARSLAQEMQMIRYTENDYEIKEKAIKRKMKNMMEDIQKQINQKRSLLIDKLERMRRLHEIEQKLAAKRLIEIKRQVGSQILNINKKGSPDKCFTLKNPVEINEYCMLAYHDVELQIECKNPKQFCYMCCDAELGVNKENSNCCYNRCDMIKRQGSCTDFYETYHINDIIISHQ